MAPKLGQVVENVNPEELFNVISGAASQDPVRLQASSNRLKELLDMTGTFDGLSDIASQKALPLAVRQQSIIQFKNSALSHWRSRKYMSDEVRIRIRQRSLTLLDEEDDTIADCNEVIVGKIARMDFPTNWSSLVTDLMSIIDSNIQMRYTSQAVDPRSTLMSRRSIKILNEVLKEFSNYKMLAGVRTMGNLVDYLHQPLYGYYERLSSTFASTLNPTTISLPRTADDLLLAHLVYKCLVKVSTWLWQRLGKADYERLRPWFEILFQNSALQLKGLADLRINLIKALLSSSTTPDAVARRSIDQLSRHVRLLGKFFRRVQQLDIHQFVTLPMCSSVVLYYWDKVIEATNAPSTMTSDSNEAVYPVRFLVQGMVLFKESLPQWTPTPKKGAPKDNTLSQQFVEDAVKLLVTKFIPLKPTDLEGWMADPEEWVNLEDKENEQWEYELRPCGERVLMTLCNQYKYYVVPLLETTFKQIIALPTVDLQSVIQKEALYCAIGRCATRLHEVIPFNQWLEHSLIAEVRDTNPNFPIIKRRIAWLIGQWVSSGCFAANVPGIWDVLVHLLRDRGPGTDAVVRLTAASAMGECVDSLEFDPNVFAPYLAAAVTELVKIIGEADTIESKQRIAKSLNIVIDRVEIRIIPFVSIIISAIPQYWTAAGNNYIFKGTLLVLATSLVTACKEQSAGLGGIVVPLLRESMSSEAITCLDEDGLVLWQAALRNTVTIESVNGAPALIDIFPLLISLLAVNLDLLGKIISLVESYLLLGAPLVLQNFALQLHQAVLTAIAGSAISINIKDMIIALNLLIQLAPSSLWGEAMHISGLFAHLIKTVLDEETLVLESTEIIHVLARIAISDRQMFMQLMSATAISQKTTESLLYEGLMDAWWTRFDNMSEPRHRKLTAMAYASLVSTGRPEVLQRLPSEIFNLWMDVFGEIQEAYDQATVEGSSSPIRRFWDQDEPPSSYYQETEGTPEFDRRKALFERDPVRTTLLSQFVAARLQEAETVSGGAQAFQTTYLEKADPIVLQQIRAYLNRA